MLHSFTLTALVRARTLQGGRQLHSKVMSLRSSHLSWGQPARSFSGCGCAVECRTATSLAFHVFPPSNVSSSVCRLPSRNPASSRCFLSTGTVAAPHGVSGDAMLQVTAAGMTRRLNRTVLRVGPREADVQEHHTRVNWQIHLTAQQSDIKQRSSCLSILHAAH